MESKNAIVAVHIGHNASCAIMIDGEVVYASQEERFSRIKNQMGFPFRALTYGMSKFDLTGKSLAGFYYTTKSYSPVFIKSNYVSAFSIRDWHDYYGAKFYQRKLLNKSITDYLIWLRDDEKFNQHDQHFDYSFLTDGDISNEPLMIEKFQREQVRFVNENFGIETEKCQFLDHNDCHAYYAYFGSPLRGEATIVTLDAGGDGANQLIHQVNEQREICRIITSHENEIGRVFKIATLILGMRPHEHEYKLMGLSPYAKESHVLDAYECLKDLVHVNGMRISSKNRPKDLYGYLSSQWLDKRFDNIAGATQRFAEKVACKLFEQINDGLGATRFVLSGGISMNVKMNKAISELPFVKDFFVCGSGADESLSIGGCYLANHQNREIKKENESLSHLSLGYDSSKARFPEYLRNPDSCREFIKKEGVTSCDIAEKLSEGDIVARFFGPTEFGSRALGNRSILADPSKFDSVKKINEAIKKRDFWMPFALSVLKDRADEYIYNPKNLDSPFMSMSFDTVENSYEYIKAGTHPYDKTVRPQFVDREINPEFYNLIEAFREITGIGALLNTSLNLHGYPIVNDIDDAFRTFENSELDHLIINDTLYSKKRD